MPLFGNVLQCGDTWDIQMGLLPPHDPFSHGDDLEPNSVSCSPTRITAKFLFWRQVCGEWVKSNCT